MVRSACELALCAPHTPPQGGSQAKLAVGTKDGHVHIWSLQTKKAVRIACPDAMRNQAIVDLQWDPLSNVYLIATYASGNATRARSAKLGQQN